MIKTKFRSFFQFLITYFAVMLCTVAFLVPVYVQSHRIIRQNIISGYQEQIRQMAELIQQDMSSAYRLAVKIQTDPGFQTIKVFHTQAQTDYIMPLLAAQDLLVDTSGYMSDHVVLMVAFSNNDILITNKTIYYDYSQMYQHFYYYDPLDYTAWKEHHFSTGNFNYQITVRQSADDNSRPYTALVMSIPIGAQGRNQMVLIGMIQIDAYLARFDLADVLADGFLILDDPGSGPVLRCDGAGTHILQNSEFAQPKDPADFTLIQSFSAIPELAITLGISNSFYNQQMQSINRTVSWYVGVVISLGILLSFLFAWNHYRSVESSVSFLSRIGIKREGNVNDYKYIHNALNSLNNMKNKIVDENKHLSDYSSKRIIEKLIRIGLSADDDLDTITKICPDLPEIYRLVLVQLQPQADRYQNINDVMILLNINEHFRDGKFVQFDKDEYWIIMPSTETRNLSTDSLTELALQTEINYGIILRFVISRETEGLDQFHACYLSCRSVIRFMDEHRVLHIDQICQDFLMPTTQTLDMIKHLILDGQIFKAKQVVYSIWHELSSNPCEDPTVIEQLFYIFQRTLSETVHQGGLTDLIELPLYHNDLSIIEHAFSIAESIDRINEEINRRRTKLKDTSVQRLMSLIHKSYLDVNLTIHQAADEIAVSTKTVDRICKEKTGMTFFYYVESLRLKEARRLLQQTKQPVNEIAKKTGFFAPNTFYKAFRRQYGVSPTAFRTMRDVNDT